MGLLAWPGSPLRCVGQAFPTLPLAVGVNEPSFPLIPEVSALLRNHPASAHSHPALSKLSLPSKQITATARAHPSPHFPLPLTTVSQSWSTEPAPVSKLRCLAVPAGLRNQTNLVTQGTSMKGKILTSQDF